MHSTNGDFHGRRILILFSWTNQDRRFEMLKQIDFSKVKTPAYIVDERLLENNLGILKGIMDKTGCKILLAQKGFSMFSMYPLIGRYLAGTTASSLFEAKLGKEEMGGETHIFSPAYSRSEFGEILETCDHIVFNSVEQWLMFREDVLSFGRKITCGIRVNPEYAEVEHEIYNPCCEGSRLGTTLSDFEAAIRNHPDALDGIEGLHFHVMCEQNSDTLERVLNHFEEKFGKYIAGMKWINFGGGHHITRPDYDQELLIKCICRIRDKYSVDVYLEPGEAVALNTGYLVSTVIDIKGSAAIMDASAACHMPDVLEMPYRPEIIGAGMPNEKTHTYRLGGNTCLAGDIIGDYSFDESLIPGDKLVFCDMAHYSMVKNNTFNGIGLPSILSYNEKDGIRIIKEFGYEDFKGRLS